MLIILLGSLQMLLIMKIRAGAAAGQGDTEWICTWVKLLLLHRVSRASPSLHQHRQALSHVCLHPQGWHAVSSATAQCYCSDSDIWGRDEGGAIVERWQVGYMFICFSGFIWCLMNSDTCNMVLGICFWIQHLYMCLRDFSFHHRQQLGRYTDKSRQEFRC